MSNLSQRRRMQGIHNLSSAMKDTLKREYSRGRKRGARDMRRKCLRVIADYFGLDSEALTKNLLAKYKELK